MAGERTMSLQWRFTQLGPSYPARSEGSADRDDFRISCQLRLCASGCFAGVWQCAAGSSQTSRVLVAAIIGPSFTVMYHIRSDRRQGHNITVMSHRIRKVSRVGCYVIWVKNELGLVGGVHCKNKSKRPGCSSDIGPHCFFFSLKQVPRGTQLPIYH